MSVRTKIDVVRARARAFAGDRQGAVAVLFAASALAVMAVIGGGIDLGRAYTARQKLSAVAMLACQYASRPSVAQPIAPGYTGTNGSTTYKESVATYVNSALNSLKFGWTQTNPTPFDYTPGGSGDVTLRATVPTTLMQVAQITQINVSASSHCYDNSSALVPAAPTPPSPYVLREGFEKATGCPNGASCYISANGSTGSPPSSPSSVAPSSPSYTGTDGAAWIVQGYCLETNPAGVVNASVAEGSRATELDCDNNSHSAGNSSISTKTYLQAGNYELRYYFKSRVTYSDYAPAYVCGSTAGDVSWANSTNSVANALRTNQVNVYLDLNTSGSPPLHTTILNSQQLAGSNLIDVCVYAPSWIERSVRIRVTRAGDYWLSFAADGQNDSYGGQIDNIRLCNDVCPGTVQDNFPSAWLAANNGGTNKVLFRDTFEAPVYTSYNCGGSTCASNGNLNNSTGTSGATGSGWPSQTALGWATAPYNQVDYWLANNAQGSQAVGLDGSNSGSATDSNRLISRPFLLDPGFYSVAYYYRSTSVVSGAGSNVYCGATPAAANIASSTSSTDTNIVAVFMSHAQLASTPIGGGALNSVTSFTNPTGTTSTTPTVPPNGVSLSNYNASQPNPLLDICGYGAAWQARTATIRILKPAYYWLTMSALGNDDQSGGQIDDVRFTALGSLAMSAPPANPVTIPVPNPQPGATTSFTGFDIVADPLTVPAALP